VACTIKLFTAVVMLGAYPKVGYLKGVSLG
jgi:hypothetical protein